MTLIAILGLTLLVSGCIDSTNQSSAIGSSPEVRQLPNESLPARIAMTYWSKEDVARAAADISQQCEKSIEPAAMYKITIGEGDLKVVSWIDAKNHTLVCSATEGVKVQSISMPVMVNTSSTPTPAPAPSDGRLQLRVYRCSDVEVSKDLGFISGETSINFDWETSAEGWWEDTGWKLLVDGKPMVDEGIPVFEYRSSAGHITKNVMVNGNVQLVYRIYKGSYCANSDHYNTFMWVDNVVVGRAGNFSDNFDNKDLIGWSKKSMGNADITITSD